jgi:hypothetical protein
MEELDLWVEKSEEIKQQFSELNPSSDSNFDYLQRIFTRNIRNNDDYDEEDDDTDDEWDSDEEIEESCPDGCDEETFNAILELREMRLKSQSDLKVLQKELSTLKRTHEGLNIKEKQIERELLNASQGIQAFQTNKQHLLNELSSIVPFRADQMYLWDENKKEDKVIDSAAPLGENIIFSSQDLTNLLMRVKTLRQEIDQDRLHSKSLQMERRRMENEEKVKEKEIHEQEERCNELQILKFGQLVDIDELNQFSKVASSPKSGTGVEQDTPNPEAILEETRQKNDLEIKAFEKDIGRLKDDLKDMTETNTGILNKIADLSERQIQVEKKISNDNKKQSSDFAHKRDLEEIKDIEKLSATQADEIEKLKQEIVRLRRKDGKLALNEHCLSIE